MGCSDTPVESEPGLFFPTTREESDVSMAAEYSGPLVVLRKCVLVGNPGDYSLPIWPPGFSAARDGSGRLVVRDSEANKIAAEGESFKMGGGFIAEFQPQEKVEPREVQMHRVEESLGYSVPRRCLGPDDYGVWLVAGASLD